MGAATASAKIGTRTFARLVAEFWRAGACVGSTGCAGDISNLSGTR